MAPDEETIPPDAVISMEWLPPPWLCPRYTVSIRADGSASYEHIGGHGSVTIAPQSVRALFETARDGLAVWNKSYELPAPNEEGRIVTIRMGSRVKQIRDFPSCHGGLLHKGNLPGTPTELCQFENAIEEVAGVATWLQCPNDAGVRRLLIP
jgi:hypothetical protein